MSEAKALGLFGRMGTAIEILESNYDLTREQRVFIVSVLRDCEYSISELETELETEGLLR